jgi:hypothetical protein
MSVTLPRSTLRTIQTQAKRKGITDQVLIVSLLRKIAEDDLFAAVLDEYAALAGGLCTTQPPPHDETIPAFDR